MIYWYLTTKNTIRAIGQKSHYASLLCKQSGKESAAALNIYMSSDYEQLWKLWRGKFPEENLGELSMHIKSGEKKDYLDIINVDLPELEKRADTHLLNSVDEKNDSKLRFEALLHPIIIEHSYQLYLNGHLREAVLNSITAVYDFVRVRTSSVEDGDRLISQVMSLNDPKLILSELRTESGQNDQKGFMQIFKGAYQGIRNPKAHSLTHDLTNVKAAQYLVFSSLLARRIEEAEIAMEKTN